MDLFNAIKQRRSVRTFNGQVPSQDILQCLETTIESVRNTGYRLETLYTRLSENIGSYGIIKNAPAWLVLITDGRPGSILRCAMEAEKIVLQLTGQGIGTCWIGGTFSNKDVASKLSIGANEKIAAVIPFGIAADKPRLTEKLQSSLIHSKTRKPFSTLFKVDDNAPEVVSKVLEAVRLAPSAVNAQPWRIEVDASGCAVFHSNTDNKYTMLDMGIALAHFALAAHELSFTGKLLIPDNPTPAHIADWVAS